MRLKRFGLTAALILAAAHAPAAGLNVVGHVNVASNLTAQSITLGGQTRSNWPGGRLAGFQDLGHEPVLGTSEAGLFSIVL